MLLRFSSCNMYLTRMLKLIKEKYIIGRLTKLTEILLKVILVNKFT